MKKKLSLNYAHGCPVAALGCISRRLGLIVVLSVMPYGGMLPAATPIIHAVFGDAVSGTNTPAGWSFYSNAGGNVMDGERWTPMVVVCDDSGRRVVCSRGVAAADGTLRADRPRISGAGDIFSLGDSNGVNHCAVSVFTMRNSASNDVWINHGNLLCKAFDGTVLEIYRNKELCHRERVTRGLTPLMFQKNMGRLQQGDAISIVVIPGEQSRNGKAGGRLRFIVAEYPGAPAPEGPFNILAPVLGDAEPQRDAAGDCAAYHALHQAQCREVLDIRPALVLLGDSITARWPPELLAGEFGHYRPVKLGIGGDWIQNLLWRIRNGVLDKAPPRVAVLLIGTNNLTFGNTPEEIAAGITELIRALHAKTPATKVLLLGLLPRGPSRDIQINDKIRFTNSLLAGLADGEKTFFFDPGPALIEADGTIKKAVLPDNLHPGLPGYERWMACMEPCLRSLLEQSN